MAETKNKSTFHHIEIPEGWEYRKLGDIGKIRMCKRVFNHETSEEGDIPFFKIGTFGKEPDAFISKKLYENYRKRFSFPKVGDILISAAGTLGRTVVYDGSPAYFQDSNIVWIDNGESLVINRYLFYIYQTIKYESEGGTIQRLYNSIISDAKFLRPPLPEQRAIAQVLSTADAAIHTTEKLIAQKELRKKWLMQQLLTGKIRLKGFGGEWGKERLDKYLVKHDEKTTTNNQYPVLTSSRRGIFLQSDYYTRDVASEDNTGYNVVPRGFFTYRHMSDDLVFKFNINDIVDKGIVSTLYPVFTTKGINDYFLLAKLNEGNEFKMHAGEQKQGGSRTYVYFNTLCQLKLNMPSIEEQTAIARVLQAADKEINLLKAKVEKLREQKKGLMQQLLTGKVRLKINQKLCS